MQEVLNIASIVGGLLAIVGLVFAALQYRDAKTLATDLLEIRDSLSTRFIGEFPSYIPNVTDLIKQAQNEIVIVSPCPPTDIFPTIDHLLITEMQSRPN